MKSVENKDGKASLVPLHDMKFLNGIFVKCFIDGENYFIPALNKTIKINVSSHFIEPSDVEREINGLSIEEKVRSYTLNRFNDESEGTFINAFLYMNMTTVMINVDNTCKGIDDVDTISRLKIMFPLGLPEPHRHDGKTIKLQVPTASLNTSSSIKMKVSKVNDKLVNIDIPGTNASTVISLNSSFKDNVKTLVYMFKNVNNINYKKNNDTIPGNNDTILNVNKIFFPYIQ